MFKSLAFVFALVLTVNVAVCQEVDERERSILNMKIEARLTGYKKLSPFKEPVADPAEPQPNFDQIGEGWIGGFSFVPCKIVSISGPNEMLIQTQDYTFRLKEFATKDLVTDQKVRLIGPLKAGPTEDYETVLGAKKTVRTFTFLRGDDYKSYLQSLSSKLKKSLAQNEANRAEMAARNREEQANQRLIQQLDQSISNLLWGDEPKPRFSRLNQAQLKRIRNEVERIEKIITVAKLNESLSEPYTCDLKKRKFEFRDEKTRSIALDRLSELTADVPK